MAVTGAGSGRDTQLQVQRNFYAGSCLFASPAKRQRKRAGQLMSIAQGKKNVDFD